MKRLLLVSAGILFAFPATAKEPCPPPKGEILFPWFIPDLMDGDEFADVYIDVDAKGRPIGCRIGGANIRGDTKFFVCKAFMEQFTTATPPAGKTTVTRRFVNYGTPHMRAENRLK